MIGGHALQDGRGDAAHGPFAELAVAVGAHHDQVGAVVGRRVQDGAADAHALDVAAHVVGRRHALGDAIGGQVFERRGFALAGGGAFVHGQHHQVRGRTQQRRGIREGARSFAAAVPADQHAVADHREIAAGRHHQHGAAGRQQGLLDEFGFVRGLDVFAVVLADDDEVAGAAIQRHRGAGGVVTRAHDRGHIRVGSRFQEGVLHRAAILRLQVAHHAQGLGHQHGFAVVVLRRRRAGVDADQFGVVALGQGQRNLRAAGAIEPVVQVYGNAAIHGGLLFSATGLYRCAFRAFRL